MNILKTSKVLFVILVCTLPVGTHADNGTIGTAGKELLVNLEVVTETGAATDPGAFDSQVYFNSRLAIDVFNCTKLIYSQIKNWAQSYKMKVVKEVIGASNLELNLSSKNPPGVFEFTYYVDEKNNKARLQLFFYDLKGNRRSGNMPIDNPRKNIESWLGPRLFEAMQCV